MRRATSTSALAASTPWSRRLTQEQRRRWIELLLSCSDELGVPDDPEFRSAFVAYLEWGTRLAVLNSEPGVVVTEDAPMPRWGWGDGPASRQLGRSTSSRSPDHEESQERLPCPWGWTWEGSELQRTLDWITKESFNS
jgi:hypothetical protein